MGPVRVGIDGNIGLGGWVSHPLLPARATETHAFPAHGRDTSGSEPGGTDLDRK